MPLYEYQCETCGRFELIRKFSDEALSVCPTCGGEVQKLFSAPAIQFKGTGWYITDYAKKSSGKDGGADKGEKDASSPGKDASSAKDAPAKDAGAKESKSSKDSGSAAKDSSTSAPSAPKDSGASSGSSSSSK